MTQVQFETSKANLLFVMLLEWTIEYSDFYVSGLGFLCAYKPNREVLYNEQIPLGNWQPLGFVSSLSEEDMEKVCESGSYMRTFKNYITCDNHKSNQMPTVYDSFASLLTKAEVYLENPFGKSNPMDQWIGNVSHGSLNWQSAQSRTSKHWFLLAEFKI